MFSEFIYQRTAISNDIDSFSGWLARTINEGYESGTVNLKLECSRDDARRTHGLRLSLRKEHWVKRAIGRVLKRKEREDGVLLYPAASQKHDYLRAYCAQNGMEPLRDTEVLVEIPFMDRPYAHCVYRRDEEWGDVWAHREDIENAIMIVLGHPSVASIEELVEIDVAQVCPAAQLSEPTLVRVSVSVKGFWQYFKRFECSQSSRDIPDHYHTDCDDQFELEECGSDVICLDRERSRPSVE